ncbi:MAG: S-methyl-5'-thioinosine phosphorylase [Anaerolineales bacterium]|nr:S-methyl-5'-thioinosine phosphorylase [Anaerolineales bacterium]
MTIRTGFITGTGFYTLPNIKNVRLENVQTPFGDVSVEIGKLGEEEIAFIARHGKQHTIAPDKINFRANIYAMHMLGVERILATSVSGSLHLAWPPGTLVLIDQFLDFTKGRVQSFYPLDGKLAHVDVTDPYCPTMRQLLMDKAHEMNIPLQQGATYACFSGPRFETRAEIEMVRRLGGDLVGQTNFPESMLAREMAICYATVGVVSNLAAGMKNSSVTATEVTLNLKSLGDTIANLFEAVVCSLPEPYDCSCCHALDEAFL